MQTAPILLFTFKRLDTLKKTVGHLQENDLVKESDLIIYSDQALIDKDKSRVSEVRTYLRTITGFKSIRIVEASTNLGLARSIISGVSETIKVYGKAIVLEDDILTTPNFLCFMNEALLKYENSQSVYSISGYSFDLTRNGLSKPNADAYFINRGWSWGWATWADRWDKVDWDVKDYAAFTADRRAQKKFAAGGSDLNAMLKKQMLGRLDSWAIRWFYHQFRISGLTLYPVLSKVYNDGFDELATHTKGSSLRYKPVLDSTGKTNFSFPAEIRADPGFQKSFAIKMGVRSRIISRVHSLINKFSK